MPRPPVSDQAPDFSGGLNIVANPASLGPSQFSVGINARLTQFGAVSKRGGTRRIYAGGNPTTPTINGLTEWALADGTRYIIRAVVSGSEALAYGVMGSLPVTFTGITASISQSPVDFAAFRNAGTADVLYVADGGLLNKLTVAAGPTFTFTANIASTPAVSCIEVFNQRLWGCGDAASPQSIFYSELNDGDTLGIGASGGGQIIVRTFGQQNVVALQALGTSLLIFHRRGVSRLTGFGQDDITAVPAGITGDTGTTARASVVRVDNEVYYVNVRGLFVATAEFVRPVNTPEKPDPLSVVLPTLTESQVANISSAFSQATRELYIRIPEVGTYVYHTLLQSWSGPWTGALSSLEHPMGLSYIPMIEAGSTSNVPVVLTIDGTEANQNTIIQMDYAADAQDSIEPGGTGGVPFTMQVGVRRMFFGDFASQSSLRWGYVLADLGNATSATLDWEIGTTEGSVPLESRLTEFLTTETDEILQTESGLDLGLGTTVQSIRVPMWGTGYYADLTLNDESTDGTPVFSRVDATGFSLGRR